MGLDRTICGNGHLTAKKGSCEKPGTSARVDRNVVDVFLPQNSIRFVLGFTFSLTVNLVVFKITDSKKVSVS